MVQEILWKVSRTLGQYDRTSAFRPWLLQVARNHLIDHHRSRHREKESTMALESLTIEPGRPASQHHELVAAERSALLRRALEEIPEVLRDAVVLRDVEGLEYDEIAQALSVPLGTVKSRINRGRLQLASLLGGAEASA